MRNAYIILFIAFAYFGAKAQCFKSVAAGGSSCGALMSNGNIRTWGYNPSGQLGNGTYNASNQPTVMGTDTDWEFLAVGQNHMLAIKTNGTLWAWGSNFFGALGNGTTTTSTVPIQIGTDHDWRMATCGDGFSTAIKTNGTLWAWGQNFNGQLGNGTTTHSRVPQQVGTDTDWLIASTSKSHTLVLKTNGSLWGFGANTYGQLSSNTAVDIFTPTQIGTSSNWVAIAAGSGCSFAINDEGELWARGNNLYGNLGDGSMNNERHEFVRVGIGSRWAAVAPGRLHTLAVASDGTMWSCGDSSNGRLGYTPLDITSIFRQVGTDSRWLLPAAANASYGIKTTHNLSVWGPNNYGQLGDSSFDDRIDPWEFYCSLLENTEVQFKPYNIFPVPAASHLFIQKQSNDIIEVIAIYNSLGQEVLKLESDTEQINVENLKSGIYFLKIESQRNDFYAKFIKQ